MAYLPEVAQWTEDEDGIYQFELNDFITGGPGGNDNEPHRILGNRTAYLKKYKAEKTGSQTQAFYVAPATQPSHATQLSQVQTLINALDLDVNLSGLVKKSGDTMTGNLTILNKVLYVYNEDKKTRTYIKSNDILLDSKYDVDADRKYMNFNMYDSASGFRMYPRGGTAIDYFFDSDSWKIDNSRLLTHKGIHITHNEVDGYDSRIVNENFGGDTGIGLYKENVNLIKHGRKVSAEFKLTLYGFSKTLPSNSDYYFEYDLLDKIKEALGNSMDGTAYGISRVIPSPALFYFYKYDPKEAALMQLAETWMITGSKVKFYIDNPAGKADGSSLTVDRVNVQFTFEILLNKD